jgi:hypothetical protein
VDQQTNTHRNHSNCSNGSSASSRLVLKKPLTGGGVIVGLGEGKGEDVGEVDGRGVCSGGEGKGARQK